jgi:hypothetical protein
MYLRHNIRTESGAHPAFYSTCTGVLSQRVKLTGRKADHSPPSSAEVKKAFIYTSVPIYVFIAFALLVDGKSKPSVLDILLPISRKTRIRTIQTQKERSMLSWDSLEEVLTALPTKSMMMISKVFGET